jgi:hypothetical protein
MDLWVGCMDRLWENQHLCLVHSKTQTNQISHKTNQIIAWDLRPCVGVALRLRGREEIKKGRVHVHMTGPLAVSCDAGTRT